RDAQRRHQFCEEMSERLSINVYPMDSATAAVRNAQIVSTATTSPRPVLNGEDLPKGIHINAIGANHAHKQELDAAAIAKANLIFVDSLEQSKQRRVTSSSRSSSTPNAGTLCTNSRNSSPAKSPGASPTPRSLSSNPTASPPGTSPSPSRSSTSPKKKASAAISRSILPSNRQLFSLAGKTEIIGLGFPV